MGGLKIKSKNSLPYIPIIGGKLRHYLGTEIYECEFCHFKWRGDSGPQDLCQKCNNIYTKWVNWETDWVYDLTTDEWDRKKL